MVCVSPAYLLIVLYGHVRLPCATGPLIDAYHRRKTDAAKSFLHRPKSCNGGLRNSSPSGLSIGQATSDAYDRW